ncbi:hypothetical protein AV530_018441 [Patagioenas fasciata monilis]|uniref:Uncharacterized protein n=1 Tax=Patagioenas fasciata monilis TaxID=372326 RepID=A0A1V4JRX0_PATFA|nr:hypothetical protein AV530_018441 [Patagioenas fasciata monilis]
MSAGPAAGGAVSPRPAAASVAFLESTRAVVLNFHSTGFLAAMHLVQIRFSHSGDLQTPARKGQIVAGISHTVNVTPETLCCPREWHENSMKRNIEAIVLCVRCC